MKKVVLSYLSIFLVTLAVVSGSVFSIKLGVEKDSNIALVEQFINSNTDYVIASNRQVDQPAVLGETTVDSSQQTEQSAVLGETSIDTSQFNTPDLCQSNLYVTNSVVDLMRLIGKDDSFENRSVLALQLGINNYTGKIDQNIQLLNWLKQLPLCQPKL